MSSYFDVVILRCILTSISRIQQTRPRAYHEKLLVWPLFSVTTAIPIMDYYTHSRHTGVQTRNGCGNDNQCSWDCNGIFALYSCSRSQNHCWSYMSNFICLVGLTEGGGRMAGGRGRRATSLQPMGFGGGSGFSQSTNMNSYRLSRLNSQQDSSYSSSTTSSSSYSTSSNIGGSGPRTRRVSDIDNQYYSSSNGGKKLIRRGICWAAAASNPWFAW